jgi:protein associated with RNAse G/E
MKILEVKRHINKPDESYECDLSRRADDYLLLKYVSDRSGSVGSVRFESGSITYAYYRTAQGYVLWRMLGPDQVLKGHLFHICRDQEVGYDRVEYLDLLLDVWVDPDGEVQILDRDEVEECRQRGAIGEEDLAWILAQESEIIAHWREMISVFDAPLSSKAYAGS